MPILQVLAKVGREIIGRCVLDAGGIAHTLTTQELQQLSHLAPFTTPGLGKDGSMSTATLILLDVNLAEISQRHAAFREPTVERQCVPCLDVDDVRRVPLLDQRGDKRAEMVCQRTSGAADKRGSAFIR